MSMAVCCFLTNEVADDKNARIAMLLEEYDPYIIRQVEERMHQRPYIVRPEVLDLETDDLAQRVRIKFWHALQEKSIEYPRTYIKRIVNSEFIDQVRRLKPQHALALPMDEEGELYQGHIQIVCGEGMADPADEYEQKVDVLSRMQEAVDAVLQLPERQQHALICTMRDSVEDVDALSQAFKERKADLETWQWPHEHTEKMLLRASLTYARCKVSKQMKDAGRIQAVYLARKGRRRVKRECATVC